MERADASEGLEYAISTIKGLDSKFTALLQYGTRNGELEHVLEEAATLCGEDAEHAADRLCTVFEPLILGFAALLILLFLLAVLLPVFGIL